MTVSEKIHKSPQYKIALLASLGLAAFLLFAAREYAFPEVSEGDSIIEFVDIEHIKQKKRVTNARYSSETGKIAEESSDEASGEENLENYADLDYYQNVKKPSVIGKLNVKHPKMAIDLGLEAVAYLRVYISDTGEIRKLKIIRIVLSGEVPDAVKVKLNRDFKIALLKAFEGKRYAPAIIEGKPMAVQSIQAVQLNLN